LGEDAAEAVTPDQVATPEMLAETSIAAMATPRDHFAKLIVGSSQSKVTTRKPGNISRAYSVSLA
jgi:hypothetical protein